MAKKTLTVPLERPGKPLTLAELTQKARLGEPLTTDELRFAVCAYDVLLAQMKVERYEDQLTEYFKAGDAVPEVYLTPANHPDNPDFVSWYRAINKIPEVMKK